MKQHGFELDIAELMEAATLQTEIMHHRLALEWGHMVFTRAVQLGWNSSIGGEEMPQHEGEVMRKKNTYGGSCRAGRRGTDVSGALCHVSRARRPRQYSYQ
jgi:hypothetical protein